MKIYHRCSGELLLEVNNNNLKWANLVGANLVGSNLIGANLVGANLLGANLEESNLELANLRIANLVKANLVGANLKCANLVGANMEEANLKGANLEDANLRGVNLVGANLEGANLEGTNLRGVNLVGTNLEGAKLPHFQICPLEGAFIAYKKTTKGVIKVQIPEKSKRTSSLVGRKCRAEFVKVISGKGCGGSGSTKGNLVYNKWDFVHADEYNPDIRVECTHGIHFFMTEKEAEEW